MIIITGLLLPLNSHLFGRYETGARAVHGDSERARRLTKLIASVRLSQAVECHAHTGAALIQIDKSVGTNHQHSTCK